MTVINGEDFYQTITEKLLKFDWNISINDITRAMQVI